MVNYYTGISLVLPWSKEVQEWAISYAEAIDSDYWDEDPGDVPPDIQEYIDRFNEDMLGVSIEPGNDGLWVHTGESANMGAVCWWITDVLDHFELDDVIEIEWAATASRPVPGAYGGGSVLVSRLETWWPPRSVISENIDRMKKDIERSRNDKNGAG